MKKYQFPHLLTKLDINNDKVVGSTCPHIANISNDSVSQEYKDSDVMPARYAQNFLANFNVDWLCFIEQYKRFDYYQCFLVLAEAGF